MITQGDRTNLSLTLSLGEPLLLEVGGDRTIVVVEERTGDTAKIRISRDSEVDRRVIPLPGRPLAAQIVQVGIHTASLLFARRRATKTRVSINSPAMVRITHQRPELK